MKDFSKLIDAHKFVLRRYKAIILHNGFNDEVFLVNFCDTAQTLSNPDKLSRWVGYIQGILIERKLIDTDIERDFTREIYKPIYDELGFCSNTVTVGNITNE